VNLDRRALYQHGHECLDAKAVKGRARLSSTGWSRSPPSRNIPDLGCGLRSTIRLADLDVGCVPLVTDSRMTKGLKSSSRIFLGSPHSWSFSSGRPRSPSAPSSRRACQAGSGGTCPAALEHVGGDFSLRLPVPVRHGRGVRCRSERRPASWSMRFSLRTMISRRAESSSRLNRCCG